MNYARQLVLCISVAALTLGAWLVPLDSAAELQVDAGLKRALASFATARALNAIISVVEGTEIAAQPAGVGVKFSVGQVLRPINDVVEQFAHLMLVASIAFGIEKILLSIGAHWLMSGALTAAAVIWGYGYLRRSAAPPWISRVLVVLLMARFAVPAVTLGSDLLFQHFMSTDYESSQSGIAETTEQLTDLHATTVVDTKERTIFERVRDWFKKNASVKNSIASLKDAAEEVTGRIINLMVIFVLQTILLPIFLLWVLWTIAKGTFEVRARPAGRASQPAQASS